MIYMTNRFIQRPTEKAGGKKKLLQDYACNNVYHLKVLCISLAVTYNTETQVE